MKSKYISTIDFEIIEKPTFFEVDEAIAETISILNKKGYQTQFCCAGHNADSYYCPINLLDEIKKDERKHIGKIEKDFFWYYGDTRETNVYIKFLKHYDFLNLPNGFIYETADDFRKIIENSKIDEESKKDIVYGDNIYKIIYYFENDKRIADEIIEKQIKESNEILLSWAKKLPDMNELDFLKKLNRVTLKKEVIENYQDLFLNISTKNFSNSWRYSSLLLKFYLEKEEFSKIVLMDTYSITNKILSEYQDVFLEIIEDKLPKEWEKSTILFNFCLTKNRLDLARKFTVFEEVSKELLQEIKIKVNDIIEFEKKCIDYNIEEERRWINDEKFLKEYYCFDLISREIIVKNSDKIIEILNNDFPNCWKQSLGLFKLCLERKRLDLIKQFEITYLPMEIVTKHSKTLINLVEKNNPKDLKFNKSLMELCLMENRLDLVRKFELNLLFDDVLIKYRDKFFEIMEEDFPKKWKDARILLYLCEENEKYELVNKFSKSCYQEANINQEEIDNLLNNIDTKLAEIEREEAEFLNKIKPIRDIK